MEIDLLSFAINLVCSTLQVFQQNDLTISVAVPQNFIEYFIVCWSKERVRHYAHNLHFGVLTSHQSLEVVSILHEIE